MPVLSSNCRVLNIILNSELPPGDVYNYNDKDHMSALQLKNTSESDLRSYEVTEAVTNKAQALFVGAPTGFKPMTSAILVGRSTQWAMKPCWKQVKCEFSLYLLYEFFLGFICNCLSYYIITARITFTQALPPNVSNWIAFKGSSFNFKSQPFHCHVSVQVKHKTHKNMNSVQK